MVSSKRQVLFENAKQVHGMCADLAKYYNSCKCCLWQILVLTRVRYIVSSKRVIMHIQMLQLVTHRSKDLWHTQGVYRFKMLKKQEKRNCFIPKKGLFYWIVHDDICIFHSFIYMKHIKQFFLNMVSSSPSLNQKKHTLFFSEQADEFHSSMDYVLYTQASKFAFWKEYST